MLLPSALLVAALAWSATGAEFWRGPHSGEEHAQQYSDEWTASIEGGPDVAQLVALQAGYVYVGQVLGFPDTYLLRRDDHALLRRNPSHKLTQQLNQDSRVIWAEQQFDKTRVKRYFIPDSEKPLYRVKRIDETDLSHETTFTTAPNGENTIISENITVSENITNSDDFAVSENSGKWENEKLSRKVGGMLGVTSHQGRRKKRAVKESKPMFNDELWGQEWYLQDTRMRPELPRLDLNVLPVYQAGINGKGVRVVVLDDGIEHQHSDLRDNYDAQISWDCNDGDPDPTPRTDERRLNSHGTRCAGEIAMVANNGKCGVGVAWGSRVGGVRMLDGRVNDRVEGEALGFAWDRVDIYSASWGPNDDGRTVEGPGRLALHALRRGVEKGRKGKGVIFVWANGNGGSRFDNCNCDGYSSSIYTVSIGSASQHGRFPWYGETCSSTLAAAYSSGAYGDQKIATTDVGDTCTLKHTGTSAAAPLAAGIIALVLQANPALTWRDVQHLLAWTSEQAPLISDGSGWRTNSAGLRFDVRFGFGVLNAAAMVTTALNWTTVPPKTICSIDALPLANSSMQSGMSMRLMFPASGCVVEYLEHVELVTNVRYSRRGALSLQLTSPRGTTVDLLSPRKLDASTAGFVNWRLASVATWGERPGGLWTAVVEDKENEGNTGSLGQFTLVLHGTEQMPEHMKSGPRIYNDHRYSFNGHEDETAASTEFDVFGNFNENELAKKVQENNKYDNSIDLDKINEINMNTGNNDLMLENILNNKGLALDTIDEGNINTDNVMLNELEKALFRVHHRMAKFSEEFN